MWYAEGLNNLHRGATRASCISRTRTFLKAESPFWKFFLPEARSQPSLSGDRYDRGEQVGLMTTWEPTAVLTTTAKNAPKASRAWLCLMTAALQCIVVLLHFAKMLHFWMVSDALV